MESKPKTNLLINRNLQIIFLITLMAVLGVASLTPAFPGIAKHFSLDGQKIGLLIIFFTLPGVILTPVLGVFADRIGRKKVLVPSLLLFGIAGFSCSLVNNFHLLLIFRLVQGIGAASLGSINVTLIGDIFKGKERPTAMGLNASILSIATASYPFIGGLLASISWNAPFYLPILALPIAIIVLFGLDNPEPKSTQTLGKYLISAFGSLKNRNAVILFIASIITFILLYGSFLTYIPLLLDSKFNTTPVVIGLLMSVMSLTTAMFSSQLGRLSIRYGNKSLLIFSFFCYGLAMFLIPLIPSIYLLVFPVILYGVGHGLNMPSIQTMLADIAPIEYRAAFMSMNGMVLRIGQTLGPILMGYIYLLGSTSLVFTAGGVLAILMVVPLFYLKYK